MNITSQKNLKIFIFVLVAVITLGVGYAAITAITLNINGTGTATANQENFKVHFTRTSTITENMGSATISAEDDTVANLTVTGLSKKGDTAKAVYTVINESNGVGASISLEIENSNTEYFKITEKIDETELKAGETTLVTVTVELVKTPIEDGISTTIKGTLTASPIEDESVTSKGSIEVSTLQIKSFSEDSWTTIQKAVKSGNTSLYKVGDTKKVTIGEKEYTLRIANKTTTDACKENADYSQTACGFVVEFAEIVEKRVMNSGYMDSTRWPGTELYQWLQGEFYNSLPKDLRDVIADTQVVSGHEQRDTTNWTTTDKLYLLAGKEVFGSDEYDTSSPYTRQLDYYQGMEPDAKTSWQADAYSRTYKGYGGSDGSQEWYWLRGTYPARTYTFRSVDNGFLHGADVNFTGGVSPAFRIG